MKGLNNLAAAIVIAAAVVGAAAMLKNNPPTQKFPAGQDAKVETWRPQPAGQSVVEETGVFVVAVKVPSSCGTCGGLGYIKCAMCGPTGMVPGKNWYIDMPQMQRCRACSSIAYMCSNIPES